MFSLLFLVLLHQNDSLRFETENIFETVGGWFISFYQMTLSRIQGDVCNFTPSCSHYTEEAIKRYGIVKGVVMGADRLLRCHPGAWSYEGIYYGSKYVEGRGWKLVDRPEDNTLW